MLIALSLVVAAAANAADWQAGTQPAYRALEHVTDGVYATLSDPLGALLPGGGEESPKLSAIPTSSSNDVFAVEFARRQDSANHAVIAAMPSGEASSAQINGWRRRAISEETKVFSDSLAATLGDRYRLRGVGQDFGRFVSDPSNWDARNAASSVFWGSAYAYAAGLRAHWTAGAAVLDVDVNSGAALQKGLSGGDSRLAAVRLSPKGSPFSLHADWAVRSGRAVRDVVGVSYAGRF